MSMVELLSLAMQRKRRLIISMETLVMIEGVGVMLQKKKKEALRETGQVLLTGGIEMIERLLFLIGRCPERKMCRKIVIGLTGGIGMIEMLVEIMTGNVKGRVNDLVTENVIASETGTGIEIVTRMTETGMLIIISIGIMCLNMMGIEVGHQGLTARRVSLTRKTSVLDQGMVTMQRGGACHQSRLFYDFKYSNTMLYWLLGCCLLVPWFYHHVFPPSMEFHGLLLALICSRMFELRGIISDVRLSLTGLLAHYLDPRHAKFFLWLLDWLPLPPIPCKSVIVIMVLNHDLLVSRNLVAILLVLAYLFGVFGAYRVDRLGGGWSDLVSLCGGYDCTRRKLSSGFVGTAAFV
ncbi:hypothetical protein AKJ16_DCAP10165 [Drosera capensis]